MACRSWRRSTLPAQASPRRLPLAVVCKFVDDQGGYLAALLTDYGFVSLFPLLMLVTVLGSPLHDDPAMQRQVLHSALPQAHVPDLRPVPVPPRNRPQVHACRCETGSSQMRV